MNFVLCTCYKKENYYCKNWDGKGDAAHNASMVKQLCENNNTDPDKCEFLVTPIPRKGLDWIWRTTSGTPQPKAEIVEGKVVTEEKVDVQEQE